MRFLFELPNVTKKDKPVIDIPKTRKDLLDKKAKDDEKMQNSNIVANKDKSKSYFFLPGKQPKPKKKKEDTAASKKKGSVGNLAESATKFKSMQNFIQTRMGSIENIVEASKKPVKQRKSKTKPNWKSAENLAEDSSANKGKDNWKGTLKKYFGKTESSKQNVQNEISSTKDGTIKPQGKLGQTSIPIESGSRTIPAEILGTKTNVQAHDDSDSSDGAIPKPSKTTRGN